MSFRSTERREGAKVLDVPIQDFLDDVVPGEPHEKRVQALAGGVRGVLGAASLSVSAIGKGYAAANNSHPKHGIKQVDRLLSNAGLKVWDVFETWVPAMVGDRQELIVALDWTEFDRDQQSTLGACLVSSHGRATPLIWATEKAALLEDGGRTDHETVLLMRLREVMPEVTTARTPIPAIVCVKAKGMKEPWLLATSRSDLTASAVVKIYGRRFPIEETFRDLKDPRYCYGLSATRVRSPKRRDRLFLLFALTHVLLTLLGAASERSGYDRMLEAQHVEEAHPLALQSRALPVRRHPQHVRRPARADHGALRGRTPRARRRPRTLRDPMRQRRPRNEGMAQHQGEILSVRSSVRSSSQPG